MKNKSNSLRKKEKNRFSVFTDDLTKCIICSSPIGIEKHEILYGRNRQNSIKYGFVIPLCHFHHNSTSFSSIHNDKALDILWQIKVQEYFENNLGSTSDFIKIFGRSFIDKYKKRP